MNSSIAGANSYLQNSYQSSKILPILSNPDDQNKGTMEEIPQLSFFCCPPKPLKLSETLNKFGAQTNPASFTSQHHNLVAISQWRKKQSMDSLTNKMSSIM